MARARARPAPALEVAAGLLLLVLAGGCRPAPGLGDDEDSTSASSGEAETQDDLPPELGECEQLEQLVATIEQGAEPAAAEQAVESFVREVAMGAHGFPIVEDQRLCVVHLGTVDGPVSLAGDFNDWAPDEHPLIPASAELRYAIVELDQPPAGLYKLVLPGELYLADPLARRFGWDEFGEYSQIDAIAERSHHERWPAFDLGTGELEPRTLTVWLPAAVERGASPLPLLVMHDGQNLFDPEALFGGWQVGPTLDEAIGAGTLAPMMVVGIDNSAARIDEYTHVEDVIEGQTLGGRAHEYADFVVEGVLPFIEARYPVAEGPASVATMGSSLGGLVSLYLGLRHPESFGHVASMSGTVGWGSLGAQNPTILDELQADPPAGVRIYLDSGGDEGLGCPEDGSDNYCANVELADGLRALGWVDEQDLFYRWEPGAPHSEAAWAARLLPALLDWFPAA